MRLNQNTRAEILHQAMKDTFDKRKMTLEQRENALAERAYNHVVSSKAQEMMDAVQMISPKLMWFKCRFDIGYNVAGQRHILVALPREGFHGYRVPYDYIFHHTPALTSFGTFTRDKDPELVDAIMALVNDKETYTTERKAAETTLRLLMKGVQSTESLFKVWPEGKKFYSTPPLTPQVKVGVPAVQVDALNKALGLVST